MWTNRRAPPRICFLLQDSLSHRKVRGFGKEDPTEGFRCFWRKLFAVVMHGTGEFSPKGRWLQFTNRETRTVPSYIFGQKSSRSEQNRGVVFQPEKRPAKGAQNPPSRLPTYGRAITGQVNKGLFSKQIPRLLSRAWYGEGLNLPPGQEWSVNQEGQIAASGASKSFCNNLLHLFEPLLSLFIGAGDDRTEVPPVKILHPTKT